MLTYKREWISIEAAIVFIARDGFVASTYRESVECYVALSPSSHRATWSELHYALSDGAVRARGYLQAYAIGPDADGDHVYWVTNRGLMQIPGDNIAGYELAQNRLRPNVRYFRFSGDWRFDSREDQSAFNCWEDVEIHRADLHKAFGSPDKNIVSFARAEAQCRHWLQEKMRASPDAPEVGKTELKRQAQRKFPGLSGEAFKRAWRKSLDATGARGWSAPGRRKKSEASNR